MREKTFCCPLSVYKADEAGIPERLNAEQYSKSAGLAIKYKRRQRLSHQFKLAATAVLLETVKLVNRPGTYDVDVYLESKYIAESLEIMNENCIQASIQDP